MAFPNLVDRLRDALQRNVTELNNYRALYRQSQQENLNLQNISQNLQMQIRNLLDQISDLRDDIDDQKNDIQVLNVKLSRYQFPKIRKLWVNMHSKSQRSKRKKIYRSILARIFRESPDVVSANVNNRHWIQVG